MRGNRSRAGLDKEGGEWGTVPPWPWVAAGRVPAILHWPPGKHLLPLLRDPKDVKCETDQKDRQKTLNGATIWRKISRAHNLSRVLSLPPRRSLIYAKTTKKRSTQHTFCLSPKCIKLAVKRHLDPSTCVCRPDWCHSQNSSEQREFPVQILIIWLFPALWVREWVTRPSIELSWES